MYVAYGFLALAVVLGIAALLRGRRSDIGASATGGSATGGSSGKPTADVGPRPGDPPTAVRDEGEDNYIGKGVIRGYERALDLRGKRFRADDLEIEAPKPEEPKE